MHYLIYKITNNLNGKIYIGAHKTANKNDGYMGSGKIIKSSIKKHGEHNFSKEILFELSSKEEMYEKEAEIVTEEFLKGNVYNLKIGGEGGWDHICNSPDFSSICSSGVRESNQRRDYSGISKKVSESMKEQYKSGERQIPKNFINSMLGKSHTSETKNKISEKLKLAQAGNKNSQFGTMWITNEIESKKILKTDLIPEGWRKGRKIKK